MRNDLIESIVSPNVLRRIPIPPTVEIPNTHTVAADPPGNANELG